MNKNKLLVILLVAACSLGLALEFGFNYGVSNQNTYLLGGLRLYNPDLLTNDWLAAECTDFHPYFTYLAWLLYFMSSTGWSFAAANFVTITLIGTLVWLILGQFVEKQRQGAAYVLVIALMAATETTSVAGSYLTAGIFQPSTLGALGLLAAVYFFSRRRFWLCGLSVAAGGLFHVNYLLLSVPLFLAAHVIIGEKFILRRILQNLTPPLAAMALFSPLLWSTIASPGSEQARWIFQAFRAPHHYLPNTFLTEFIPFLGWHFLAAVSGWRLLSKTDGARMLRGIWMANSGMILAAFILTTIVFVPVVAQMYVWRLAPFSVLMAQMLVAAGALELILGEYQLKLNKYSYSAAVFTLLSIYGIYEFSAGWHRRLTLTILLFLLLSVFLNLLFHNRGILRVRYHALIAVVALVLGLAAILHSARDFQKRSSLLNGLSQSEAELIEWAKQSPIESVFLIPPNMENFRLHARRAVIVDFKSHPILPNELQEWYHRLKIISGADSLTSRSQAAIGYDQSVLNRLDSVFAKYPFNFAVVKLPNDAKPAAPPDYEIVYNNYEFLVLTRRKLADQ